MTVQLNLKDDELGLALAALTAVVVKTMNGQDPVFVERFTRNINIMHKELRNKEVSHIGALEVLSWKAGCLKDLEIY